MGNSPPPPRKQEAIRIELNGVGKRFNREWIFRNLTETFHPGQVYAVTGPNGAGKSTLLSVLWGQTPPSLGTIRYTGEKRTIPDDEAFQHIAIAAPYMDLIEEFTLAEHLTFHFSMKPARGGMNVDTMLTKMYLESARDKHISNFSSGMKQRVKLALAFYTQSDILFLDEPGTNLDRRAFDWYLAQLEQIPSGCTIFIASNQEAEYPLNAQKIDITRYK
ncbi:ATP-binding cassette domain-containing protein [Chryseolinea sp. T2]|uniref:ABC transporter ATP-binding protein n=1 Tax=Chryseolinea sp. T2 TaxID=3129255 RepID=UPI003076CEB1